jgi:hypothetical protein
MRTLYPGKSSTVGVATRLQRGSWTWHIGVSEINRHSNRLDNYRWMPQVEPSSHPRMWPASISRRIACAHRSFPRPARFHFARFGQPAVVCSQIGSPGRGPHL